MLELSIADQQCRERDDEQGQAGATAELRPHIATSLELEYTLNRLSSVVTPELIL